MATITKWRITMANDCYRIAEYREANSQAHKAGELVYLDASGDVTVCATDAVYALGLAMTDGSNVTTGNPNVRVQVFEAGAEVEANIVGAAEADATLVDTFYGNLYNLIRNATDKRHYINTGLSTVGMFNIIGPAGGARGALADVNPRVIARVLDSAMQGSAGGA